MLALAVILNGAAAPAMAAQDSGMHAEHHGHGGMPDEAPAGDRPDAPATGCCDGGACGCGCMVPAAVLRVLMTPPAYASTPVNADFIYALHDLSAVGAPFRPPA